MANQLKIQKHNIIKYDNKDFLNNWTKIPNAGQRNCGIFISSEKPNRLLKGGTDGEEVADLNKKMIDIGSHRVFPEIYKTYRSNEKNSKNKRTSYVEMERFNGDITDMLFKYLSKYIIKKYFNENFQCSKDVQTDLYDLFRASIPMTMGNPMEMNVYLDKTAKYFFEYPNEIETFEKLYNSFDEEKIDSMEFIEFNNIKIPSYNTPSEIRQSVNRLKKIRKRFKNSKLTEKIYSKFIKYLSNEINFLMPEISKQIFMIKYKLLSAGYTYLDNKLDNYVFKISTEQYEHFGIEFKNNCLFDDKYFYVYVIDWDSGLFKINDEDYKCKLATLLSEFNECFLNYSIHGQYSLKYSISNSLVQCNKNMGNFLKLPEEIHKIISKSYKLELDLPKYTYDDPHNIIFDIKL